MAEPTLKVVHAGRNHSLVAHTSMCGWAWLLVKTKDHYCGCVLNDYLILLATILGLDFWVWIVLGSANVSDLRFQQQHMGLLLFLVAGMIFKVKSIGVIEQPCRSPPQLC